jgi:hypothetical protein
MTEKVHKYNDEINKCPNCRFFNSSQNVMRHINSIKNKNRELCKKYQTTYSRWYYSKMT